MIALTVPDIAARLNARIADLACALLGEPNRVLSSRAQLRFGKKGSVAVEIDGADAGKWFDHEAGVGGDGLELIRHRNGIANGEACDWARRWLGLDAEASAAGSRSNAGKVAHIVARSEAIAGTRVEAYLRSRGITASPPDCIRFRPFAAGPYGALVALATDASGAVLAVQQIYLTEDGRKAPVDVVKRTNKAVDGWSERAALRLPGAAPVVLCEGVETALSIWQATGRETWACFGIANISRAPVPQGAPVIVARDGDEPDSKADRQLKRAVAGLRARGHDVGVASPPQGTDFNDVLQNDGEQAVRDLIARTAAGRPPPACAPTGDSTCSPTWRDGLLLNHAGEPRPVLANAIHALRHAPDWDGVLWHDAFATATVARRAPPWASDRKADWTATAWSDTDDCLVAEWLQRQGIAASVVTAGQAAETVARERQSIRCATILMA